MRRINAPSSHWSPTGGFTTWEKHPHTHFVSYRGASLRLEIWRPCSCGVSCPRDLPEVGDFPCSLLLQLKTMEGDKDAVSVMQESVDQLALSMFDSLRLIPFSEEVKGGARGVAPQHPSQQQEQQQPQQQPQQPVLRRAVKTNDAWASQVQSLAEGVLKKARELDGLIDVLPGAELREDQQMEASFISSVAGYIITSRRHPGGRSLAFRERLGTAVSE